MGIRTYVQMCDTSNGHVRNLDVEFIYYCTKLCGRLWLDKKIQQFGCGGDFLDVLSLGSMSQIRLLVQLDLLLSFIQRFFKSCTSINQFLSQLFIFSSQSLNFGFLGIIDFTLILQLIFKILLNLLTSISLSSSCFTISSSSSISLFKLK